MKRAFLLLLSIPTITRAADDVADNPYEYWVIQRNSANNANIFVYPDIPKDGSGNYVPGIWITNPATSNRLKFLKPGAGIQLDFSTSEFKVDASGLTFTASQISDFDDEVHAAQAQANWTEANSSLASYILNKPTLGSAASQNSSAFDAAGSAATAQSTAINTAASDATAKANAAQAASQPLDSDLTAIAALSTTSIGRSLLAGADAAAIRTIIGAGTGSGSGTVTSVTAGTGLSGGTITATGTISLPNVGTAGTYGAVTTDAQGRVTAGKRVETYSVTTNASGVASVTFGTAFSAAPNIQINPTNFSSDNQFARVTAISTTGFTVLCRLRTDVAGLLPSFSNINSATVDVLITEK